MAKEYMCGLCDQLYDDSTANEHEHPEPQSGPFRAMWIASRLPYDEWVKTICGIEWLRQKPMPMDRSDRAFMAGYEAACEMHSSFGFDQDCQDEMILALKEWRDDSANP